MTERNVMGEPLVECGSDPLTGFYRTGRCETGPEDLGSHTICVVAARWLQSHQAGRAAPVILAATHERVLDIVPFDVLATYAADVPDDPGSLIDGG